MISDDPTTADDIDTSYCATLTPLVQETPDVEGKCPIKRKLHFLIARELTSLYSCFTSDQPAPPLSTAEPEVEAPRRSMNLFDLLCSFCVYLCPTFPFKFSRVTMVAPAANA